MKNTCFHRKDSDPSPRKGFSLIELLVVIAIIILLISILVPALERAMAAAQTAACLANTDGLGIAMRYYSMDNKQQVISHWWASQETWWYVLSDYTGRVGFGENTDVGEGVFKPIYCVATSIPGPIPPDSHGFMGSATKSWRAHAGGAKLIVGNPNVNTNDPTTSSGPGIHGNWSTADERREGTDSIGSYSINAWASSFPHRIGKGGDGRVWSRYSEMKHDTPILGDSKWVDALPEQTDGLPPNINDPYTVPQMWRFTINRHNKRLNLLFADGSAAPTHLGRLWMLKWHQRWEAGVDYTDEFESNY